MAETTKSKEEKSTHEVGSAFDLLKKSSAIVQKNWQAFAVVNILAIIGALSEAFVKDAPSDNEWAHQAGGLGGLTGTQIAGYLGLGFAALLIFLAIAIFLYAMAVSLEVKSTTGKKPSISELFDDGKKYFFRIIGVSVLSGLIIIGGLILFIVPGIIAIGRLIMSPFHLVDKDTGVLEALKQSNAQAVGRMGLVYGAIGVLILISILAAIIGAIPVIGPLIGTAITILYSLVLALRYQQLNGRQV